MNCFKHEVNILTDIIKKMNQNDFHIINRSCLKKKKRFAATASQVCANKT